MLNDKYTGIIARDYLKKRESSWKWHFEQAALVEFLAVLNPATVLDAPCGTGRFAEIYNTLGIQATGLDISQDMLDQVKGMDTVRGDILTHHGVQRDCVVCIRYLNWLDVNPLRATLKNIAQLGRSAIISITTAPESFIRHTGAFIHAESVALDAIKDCGWIVSGSQCAKMDNGATAWILLLENHK